MKKTFDNIRTDVASLHALLPQTPTSALGQTFNRGCQMLPYRVRWRFMHLAIILAVAGLAALLAGFVMRNDILAAAGCAGLLAALVTTLRLDPTQLEAQVAQTERDCNKLKVEHCVQCQQAAEEYASEQCNALQADAQAAVKSGTSLCELRDELAEVEEAFRDGETDLTAKLAEGRTTIQHRREECQRERARLSAVNKQWKAWYFPAPSRQAARAAMAANQRLIEAECDEAQMVACLKAFRDIHEGAALLGRNHGLATAAPSADSPTVATREDIPWWLGTALPPVEILEAEATNRARSQMPRIREAVLSATATGQGTDAAIEQAVDAVLTGSLQGPATIEEFMASLNGDTDAFAERRFKEASPLCPIRSIPGKKRHRKIFAFASGSATSAAVKALKERAPDSVAVVGSEHAPTELLVAEIERNVVLAELPEAMACVQEFRALPREKQELLVTAAPDDDVINSHPELAHDNGRPARLLASALTLSIITRSGSQEYHFNGRHFAKGFNNAVQALRLDQRLAAELEAKVEQAITREGFTAVIAKLADARACPLAHVPKDFVEQFQTATDEANAELQHRSTTATAVK